MRFLLLAVMTIAATLALPGCHLSAGTHRDQDVVEVDSRHRCDDYCSHYNHEGHWYSDRGHRHGPGCGHALRGGIWITLR